MKKNLVAALLMGAASLGLLAGCDDDKPKETAVKIYKSIEECKVDKPEADCQKAFEGAKEQHSTSAPKIPTREECVAKYGVDACVSRKDPNTGNEWFVPAMAGFMVGHMLSSSGQPNYQPVYTDRSGGAYSGNDRLGSYRSSCSGGDSSCRSGGFVSAPAGSSATSPAWTRSYSTTTITPTAKGANSYAIAPSTRGGFGSSASSIGKSSPSVSTPSSSSSSSAVSPGGGSARGGFGGAAASSSSGGG